MCEGMFKEPIELESNKYPIMQIQVLTHQVFFVYTKIESACFPI